MTWKHTPWRLLAAAVLVAFLATACGSSTTAITADGSLQAPAPVPLGTEPIESAQAGDHQFGATIEEWSETEQAASSSADIGRPDYAEIEWPDLIPAGSSGEEVMARFEQRLDAADPQSAEAESLWEQIQAEYNPEAVNTDLNGQKIRLAGFVAPLTYDDDVVTEFLLVPTFGACIHVPPPPPNQTIMVTVERDDGLSIDDTWGAVWVEGTLVIEASTTSLAAASYTITNATSGVYGDV